MSYININISINLTTNDKFLNLIYIVFNVIFTFFVFISIASICSSMRWMEKKDLNSTQIKNRNFISFDDMTASEMTSTLNIDEATSSRAKILVNNVTHILGEVMVNNDLHYLIIGDDLEDYILASPLQFYAKNKVKEYLEQNNGGLKFPSYQTLKDHDNYGIPLTYKQYQKSTNLFIDECEVDEILCSLELCGYNSFYAVRNNDGKTVIVTKQYLQQKYPEKFGCFVGYKCNFNYKTGTGKLV